MLLNRWQCNLLPWCPNVGPKAPQYRERPCRSKRRKTRPGMTFMPAEKRVVRQIPRPAHLWGRL